MIGNVVVIGHSSRGAISHDKMIVIDGLVTICGSTNLSTSGETLQNNEAVIVFDAVFAAEARARIDIVADEMRTQMADAVSRAA
jgi:phosphatidylserine/phosphatidylglycerophosphate/cardiolipin synthase-like enzyme